jgi:hypothetical protein
MVNRFESTNVFEFTNNKKEYKGFIPGIIL